MSEDRLVLQIKMLGGFSIYSDSKKVVIGKGNASSKYLQLLQMLWLNSTTGITKDQIIKNIYDSDNYANLNNSVNNLIYQTKKQCIAAGLPDFDYVIFKNGMYFPDPRIETVIDVNTFYELAQKAQSESDPKQRHKIQLEAIDIYSGELLPVLRNQMWVITENIRLLEVYDKVISEAGDYCKKNRDYDQMYSIYSKAADIYPDREWQIGMIDALLSKEEYTRAYKLYDKTVRYYSDEVGIPPSERMLECYERMSQVIVNNESAIEDIKSQICQAEKVIQISEGAYNCSYPGFIDAYNVLSRNMERTGLSVFLMLCNLVDYQGKSIRNEAKLKARSEDLKQVLQQTLRHGDTFTKYSDSQYLILLVGTSFEDCDTIYDRINVNLKELTGGRVGIVYNVTSLAELKSV
ncbi:MAG: bacterial transcriptional activator domain-containing protein [Butyrivibrio sp.]|nr:bacterial transcriptional activator domain-containing protein [Butyrivibrio sp.]